MKKKQKQESDFSSLAKTGFERMGNWDYPTKKAKRRKIYRKKIGDRYIKAFENSFGFSYGLLVSPDNPFARNMEIQRQWMEWLQR